VVLANLVSLLRVWLGIEAARSGLQGRWKRGAWCIVAGIVTDMLDGFIARTWNGITKFGAEWMDMIGDVVLAILPQVVLWRRGKTPGWLFWTTMAGNVVLLAGLENAKEGSLEFRRLDTTIGLGYVGSVIYCLVQYARAGEAKLLLRLLVLSPLLLIWRRPHTLRRWIAQLDAGYQPELAR
jgi:phosphatidylglycerophosphate synthase